MPIDLRGIPIPLTATPLERRMRRLFAAALGLSIIAIVAAFLARPSRAEAVVMGSIIAMIVLWLLVTIAARRSLRTLEANHFLVCPRCLTPLADKAFVSICPACEANLESPEALGALWRAAYRVK